MAKDLAEAGLLRRFRTKLLILVLMPLVPALFLAIQTNLEQRKTERVRVTAGITSLAKLIAANEMGFVKNASQLLGTLSGIDWLVLSTNREACEIHFANLLKLAPDYLNFGLIETNGVLFASGVGTNGEFPFLGDRSYFRRVLKSERFSVGDFQVGKITGQQSINFAAPVFGPEHKLRRVLFCSLRLPLLADAARDLDLPQDASVTMIDQSGTILARLPDSELWTGKKLPDSVLLSAALTNYSELVNSDEFDGTNRIYAVAVAGTNTRLGLLVAVGVPTRSLYQGANRLLARNLAIIGVVTLLALFAAWIVANWEILRPIRVLTDAANRLAQGDLTARAEMQEGTVELHRLGQAFDSMADQLEQREKQLKEATEEIRRHNLNLESAVRERTELLTASNSELEAFSYSVSHDLRAPLRHLDGFAQLLAKHAGGTLDAKGLRYLDIIGESARKMGTLIDELLMFSRMGRKEMLKSRIEMEQLVRESMEQCAQDAGDRRIEWRTQPLPSVRADGAMIRQVWINLFSNAIKYSRTQPVSIIEVGAGEKDGAHLFYVQDNGVGFDMEYASKLFGVFQRLHSDAEFEGIGIGLANVRRIILRHGGQVWAQAEPGKGATFYFTLPRHETALDSVDA